jgi:hypothetical protein
MVTLAQSALARHSLMPSILFKLAANLCAISALFLIQGTRNRTLPGKRWMIVAPVSLRR